MKRLIITLFVLGLLIVLFYFRPKVVSFFLTYEKVIAGLSYIAVVIGLFLTMLQIRGVNLQAKANTTYQIHKDGRTLFVSIDEDSFDYITSTSLETKKYSDETKRKAEKKIHEFLMYYTSIYHQHNFGYVERQYFRNVFLKELRNFLTYARVKKYWDETILPRGMWDKGFVQTVNQLLN